MGLPVDHARLLRQHDFHAPADAALEEPERVLLLRFGRWLEALASGALKPVTADQEHFVRVARGEDVPSNEFEHAWVKVAPAVPRARPRDVPGRLAQLAEAQAEAAAMRA